jgi:hypothetical protein
MSMSGCDYLPDTGGGGVGVDVDPKSAGLVPVENIWDAVKAYEPGEGGLGGRLFYRVTLDHADFDYSVITLTIERSPALRPGASREKIKVKYRRRDGKWEPINAFAMWRCGTVEKESRWDSKPCSVAKS